MLSHTHSLVLLALSASLLSNAAHACEPETITKTQSDDSLIEIINSECNNDNERQITVLFREDSASESEVMLEQVQNTEEVPTGGAELLDLDEDGFYEVAVRGMCGAGPNCEGEVYYFDPSAQSLQPLFSGGYADLFMLDEHLIESGRSGCCSWEFHAYDLQNQNRPLTYDDMSILITVSAEGDDNGTIRSVQCAFMQKEQEEWVTVAPSSDEWLELCAVYDEPYTLVQP